MSEEAIPMATAMAIQPGQQAQGAQQMQAQPGNQGVTNAEFGQIDARYVTSRKVQNIGMSFSSSLQKITA